MRKKLVVRMLCLAMAASMIGTMVPTSLYPVVAHAETARQEASTAKAVLEDGIRDKWTQDNLMGFDSVCKVEDRWHLKSSVDNGNNPGSKPAMFVNSRSLTLIKPDILISRSNRQTEMDVLVYISDITQIKSE